MGVDGTIGGLEDDILQVNKLSYFREKIEAYHMKSHYSWLIILVLSAACTDYSNHKSDWLIDDSAYKAVVEENNRLLTISNGLVSRTFSLSPDGATIGFMNLMTGNELIRAIKPEAEVTINGNPVTAGGLTGQPVKNYLAREWIAGLKPDSLSPLMLSGYQTGEITSRFEWKKTSGMDGKGYALASSW